MKSFTLIEFLIATAIFALVMSLSASSFVLGWRAFSQGSQIAQLQQNGRVVVERLSREVRQTDELILEAEQTWLNNLLETNDYPFPAPILFQDARQDDLQYVIYSLKENESKQLYRLSVYFYFPDDPAVQVRWNAADTNGNPPQATLVKEELVGEYIKEIDFQQLSSKMININLILEKEGKTLDLETKIGGRNI